MKEWKNEIHLPPFREDFYYKKAGRRWKRHIQSQVFRVDKTKILSKMNSFTAVSELDEKKNQFLVFILIRLQRSRDFIFFFFSNGISVFSEIL